MAENTGEKTAREGATSASVFEQMPTDRLVESGRNLLGALAQRGVTSISDKIESVTARLTDYAENGGSGLTAALAGAQSMAQGKSPLRAGVSAGMSGVKDKAQQVLGGGSGGGDSGGGGGGGSMKFTNIVEQIDVGIPVRVAYNQWTQFQDFPEIMKKVEHADEESDDEDEQKLNWRARVLWSPRSWEATVIDQVPDQHIVWRSTTQKAHVDGAVTFHELTANLTRILVVLEYHQQGFVEGTANLWRAAGRRARLEIKHFARHAMTQTILNPDEVEGWRGEIHDGKVVKTHEQALQEEQSEDYDDREELAENEGNPGERDEYGDIADEEPDEYEEERQQRGPRDDDEFRAAGEYDEEPEDRYEDEEYEKEPTR